jgi:tetratricopeptide (TPR) repeat protein
MRKVGWVAALTGLSLLVTISAVAAYFIISFAQGQKLFLEGHAAVDRGEYDKAISKLDAALEKQLTWYYRAYAYDNRGYCYYQKHLPDEAIHDYTEALRLNSNLPSAYYYRAVLMQNRQEHDRAFADYSNAIRCDPNFAGALYQRGLIYMLRKDFGAAVEDFSEAIRVFPQYAAAYLERGNAFLEMGRLDEAWASYDSAIAEAPAFAGAYAARARLHRRKHEPREALRDFNEAARLDPTAAAVSRERAQMMREAQRESWFMEVINQAIDRNPRDDVALAVRGGLYLVQREYDCAISDFTECIKLTQSRSAYDHRAETYFRAGDYVHAIADYEEGAHHSGKISDAATGLAWLLATCPDPLFRDGKHAVDVAKHDCERTTWKNWKCIDTLAAASAEAGNFEDAVEYENQALAMRGLPARSRPELQRRLELYQKGKPYRDDNKQ